ncbi:thioredoxin domain-containing protein [Actinomyces sp. B33]|uniref:DsbA family protein n=1 Tax=Actinomyces sp. B33 TaxID=2942131 RepID=UPI002340D31E|nr:thioredoxin domain-containing protein [Actinomyces sp. B33]MDC4233642.1 thioredoxin domain-containing protein [Actinomyces sp. B33]
MTSPSPEPPAPARRRRSPLVGALLAVIAVLVLIIALLIADRARLSDDLDAARALAPQSSQQAGAGAEPPASAVPTTDPQVLALIREQIHRDPEDPQAKGDVDADTVLVLYSDFACPYCTLFAQQIQPGLADLIDDGTLRIEWRDLAQITETSPLAAQAGLAAGEQGRFWQFHDAVYGAADPNDHPSYTEDSLVAFAQQAGVADLDRFRETMTAQATVDTVARAKQHAYEIGITGTPFMIVGDAVISGYKDLDYIRTTVLEQARSTGNE